MMNDTKRTLLLRSMYVLAVPVFLTFAALACASTPLFDTPTYVCPTMVPTSVPTTLPGTPTAIPQPTALPPTPYSITAPDPFYVNDAVFVGAPGAAMRLRFRLQNVTVHPLDTIESVYGWQIEIANVGSTPYDTAPVMQSAVIRLRTPDGDRDGTWLSSAEAGALAGLELASDFYVLAPGELAVFQLAALAPAGELGRIAYLLSEDGNRITWINALNPGCSGDIAD